MSRIRDQIADIVRDHKEFTRRWHDGLQSCNCAWEGKDHTEHLTDLIDAAVSHEYEFKCEAFVFAGPGHQSKHECEQRSPHGIDSDHHDWRYEWQGTAILEIVDGRAGRLVFNPRHHGGDCC